jgi:dTDP-4-amino-4,6-dideoxygalactose transaminase
MKPLPLPSDQDASGRSFGGDELERLARVMQEGTLIASRGSEVPALERGVAELLGTGHAIACSSGTGAFHAAIAAVAPEPGDEIVTTAITDMGALAPILYQGAIPRFADVDPSTGNVTASTLETACSPRTRAIVVTHLFGTPCVMGPILELAERRGVPIIEDCSQALLARSGGRIVGTLGAISTFSTQQGKHITSGEGGFVLTDSESLARQMRVFVNKGWPYGEPDPDHEFLATSYKMTELQAAVLNAQLPKAEGFVKQRRAMASRLGERLAGCAGLEPIPVGEGDVATYWRYALLVDPKAVPGGPTGLAEALAELGIASTPRYIRKPAFETRVFAQQRTFGNSRWPFTLADPEALDYAPERFPGTYEFLARVLVLPWNERYEEQHVDMLADAVSEATRKLRAHG